MLDPEWISCCLYRAEFGSLPHTKVKSRSAPLRNLLSVGEVTANPHRNPRQDARRAEPTQLLFAMMALREKGLILTRRAT